MSMQYIQKINGLDVIAEYSDESVHELFIPLLKGLTALQKQRNKRILVLLAAPPAAGKSTLVSFLQYLSGRIPEVTPVTAVGMDGFHHRQTYLQSHTVWKEGQQIPMTKIKGAPISFDLEALAQRIRMLTQLESCPWPQYDRKLHDPVDNAVVITGDIVLIEGNYLLLDQPGWRELQKDADYTIRILADPKDVRQRLIDRKAKGCGSLEEAILHVDRSDIPNVRLCMECGLEADMTWKLNCDGSYGYVAGSFPSV